MFFYTNITNYNLAPSGKQVLVESEERVYNFENLLILSIYKEIVMVGLLLPIIYLSFISLGLPDSLLGSAWPIMHLEFGVPVSNAGMISMIISAGTIVSSLLSDRTTRKLGTGLVTALSTALTAAALIGFSLSDSFWLLCVLAIPYGLGAGGVDASINNYVALHYESHHMSWLHCMWGLGATIGPYIMGYALQGGDWHDGYLYVGIVQTVLAVFLIAGLPLWNQSSVRKLEFEKGEKYYSDSFESSNSMYEGESHPLSMREIFTLPGAKEVMLAFFCYCGLEQTSFLWVSSYINMHLGIAAETAASLAALFYIGMTVGRALNGFLTFKWNDTQLIRMGSVLIGVGSICLLLPLGNTFSLAAIALIGLGCAPIYPCIVHSTPDHFGAQNSQAIIGVQMASAYLGTLLMPPIFGLIARHITISLYPVYILLLLTIMVVMHELLCRSKTEK